MSPIERCVIGAATVLLAAGCGRDTTEASAVGLLERDRIEIVSEAPEPIEAVHISEGDRVEAGRILLVQSPERLARRREALAAKVRQAQRRLDELIRGPREQAIRAARARLEGARSAVATEQRELRRRRALAEEGLASESGLDRQRQRFDEAVARRDRHREDLAALLEGTTVEQIDQARAAVDAAQAELAELEVRLDRLTVRAPVDAVVDALPYHVGERPAAGRPVTVLRKAGPPHARIYIPAALRARLSTGVEALVRVEGHDAPFDGRIRFIAGEASYTPYFALSEHDRGRLSYLAEVDLVGDRAGDLPSGVPVVVTFPEKKGGVADD